LSDTDIDACSEIEKLPSHCNDLLKLMWKTMQEENIEGKVQSQQMSEARVSQAAIVTELVEHK
jgi:hypothetical protein